MFINVIKTKMPKEWKAYTQHAFGALIAQGQLQTPAFNEYILQDIIYLNEYAKCWKQLAMLAKVPSEIAFAQKAALTIIEEELKFRNAHKIKSVNEIKILPATQAYIDYQHQIASENNYNYLFFALLACSTGYAYLGKYMLQFKISKKYQEWIKIYTSNTFFAYSDQIMAMAWEKWKVISKDDQSKCEGIFKNTLILEKNFFDQVL